MYEDLFIIGYDWFLWTYAPIVSQHTISIDGTFPSGWRSTVVLPRAY